MPISYTVIMIRTAGAEFPPEYSDRNLIVKTHPKAECEYEIQQSNFYLFSFKLWRWN